ncbi:MAG: FAD binding domain-containing protein [SAR324 cluster bacterium]|nr:FAD binding domain-containing protein [SAR324 cluster bacterium]
MRDYILLYINGKRYQVSGEQIFQPFSDFLRHEQGLTGTKVVCAEGDCGACTALLGTVKNHELIYEIFNTCIYYVYQLDCQHVVTIEGLKANGHLHAVQQSMIDHFSSQCGYCTPGFVVAAAGMFEKKNVLSEQDVRYGLTGNLCRCTGYQPIIQAVLAVAPDTVPSIAECFPSSAMLQDFEQHTTDSIAAHYEETITGKSVIKKFFNPATLQEILDCKKQYPAAAFVAGGTDISVQMNKGKVHPDTIISLSNLPNLDFIKRQEEYVRIGPKVCWAELEHFCKNTFPEWHKTLTVFGSPQIRNVGTIAGNIANASPVGDSLPFLFVMNAEVELSSVHGKRWVDINDFYHGYKNTEMTKEELITEIRLAPLNAVQKMKLYKVSKRKDLDIAIFTAGILLEEMDGVIQNIRIAYGGVGPVVLRLLETEAFLKKKQFCLETFREAGKLARGEITPISDVRASAEYRLQLSENILLQFYYDVCEEQPC